VRACRAVFALGLTALGGPLEDEENFVEAEVGRGDGPMQACSGAGAVAPPAVWSAPDHVCAFDNKHPHPTSL
jgi:hypothetical protein